MPEPGIGGKADYSYDGPDSGDGYGTSRNTPWGPQSAWSGLKSGGLFGALLGAINDPSMPKTMGDPGGYNTRDGGGANINKILSALKQQGIDLGGGQGGDPIPPFPFQFGLPPSQVTPNFMPQIAPPGGMPPPGQGPQNLNDLYGLYGVAPNAPMPAMPFGGPRPDGGGGTPGSGWGGMGSAPGGGAWSNGGGWNIPGIGSRPGQGSLSGLYGGGENYPTRVPQEQYLTNPTEGIQALMPLPGGFR